MESLAGILELSFIQCHVDLGPEGYKDMLVVPLFYSMGMAYSRPEK